MLIDDATLRKQLGGGYFVVGKEVKDQRARQDADLQALRRKELSQIMQIPKIQMRVVSYKIENEPTDIRS